MSIGKTQAAPAGSTTAGSTTKTSAATEKIKERVQKDMQAFIENNPNASQADVDAYASKSISKHKANMIFEKMRDDNFFNKLMARRKELIQDMW